MKHLLFSFLFITLTFALFAKGVEQNTARELALNAYYQKLVQYHDENAAYEELIITETYTISEGGIPMYFIYNFQDFGFIIIAAEDAIEPVLGYTFNSHYSSEDQPEGLAGTLSEYREHIDYLRSNQITQSTEIFQQWDDLYYFEASNFSATNNSKGDVEPLLTATWNQDDPYNFYCPEDQQGPGGRVYVGCVATAMSMIMHYWRYPLQGTGEHSYTPENTNYGVQYVNFGETTYDWDGMLDNCDGNVANLPMALIGYHTAVSVDMDFGNDGSGAYSTDVDNAFRDYFGYSNTTAYLSRSSYTLTIWENYLQAELNENRPVYYSGVDPSPTGGGHAFVLDGYHESDGFYHFNFGWSGSGNGWFLVTDAGGFTNQQGMVRNIYPNDPNYPYGCTSYERTSLEGSFEDGSGPTENHAQNANCEWIINPQTELDSVTKIKLSFKYFSTGSGDFVTIYDGESTSDPVLGTYSGSTLPTDNIYSTGNKVLITFIGDGDPVTGDGFKIEYESVLPSYGSGMTQFTTPTGTFGDGSGEFGYINGASFGWILNPTWAADITLSFTEFNTQEEDILTIKDATTQDVLATYSGDYSIGSLPEPIYCESAKLLVLWSADAAFNAPGFTAEWTVGNVGVKEENTQFDNLQVYPNPADNMLNVSFSLDNNQSFAIKLISTTGQVVYQENTSEFSGNYVNSIDLSGISKGVYFLNIANESGTVNKKVVVK